MVVNKDGSWQYQLDPSIAAKLADGEYSYEFVVTDAAGNVSAPLGGDFKLDCNPPEITFNGITQETDSARILRIFTLPMIALFSLEPCLKMPWLSLSWSH